MNSLGFFSMYIGLIACVFDVFVRWEGRRMQTCCTCFSKAQFVVHELGSLAAARK